MAIAYTRTFAHREWIDNVDRVQAGGDNGFNARFHGLETEFDGIATVVGEIAAAIASLSTAPTPTTRRLSLVPTLVATAATRWDHAPGNAVKPAGATAAHGMMAVAFPQAAKLQGLRTIGVNNGVGNLRVALFRQALDPTAAPDRIVQATQLDTNTPIPDDLKARIDNDGFKYYLLAQLDNAGGADEVRLHAVQITYQGT